MELLKEIEREGGRKEGGKRGEAGRKGRKEPYYLLRTMAPGEKSCFMLCTRLFVYRG